MTVANHGVPAALRDDAFGAIRALFALPLEHKQALLADENNRGWTPMYEETLDPAKQSLGDTKGEPGAPVLWLAVWEAQGVGGHCFLPLAHSTRWFSGYSPGVPTLWGM